MWFLFGSDAAQARHRSRDLPLEIHWPISLRIFDEFHVFISPLRPLRFLTATRPASVPDGRFGSRAAETQQQRQAGPAWGGSSRQGKCPVLAPGAAC